MKSLAIGLFVLALLPAGSALASSHDDCPSLTLGSCCEVPARWASRHETGDARLAITTEDRSVTLLLTDYAVAMQLSDRSMHKVQRKLHDVEDEGDDNALAQAIKSAVLCSVRTLLDHSIECRVRDLRSVEYRGDRLVITTNDGDRLFEKVDVDDRDVLECFSPGDARAFVAEFERVKHRGR